MISVRALLFFLVLAALPALALDIPSVPATLSGAQIQTFESRRAALVKRWTAFERAQAEFRITYAGTKEGTARAAAAEARKAELKAEADAIVEDVDTFAEDLDAAVAAWKKENEHPGPTLSPVFFGLPGEAAFCQQQLDGLGRQREFLERQRAGLKAIEHGMQQRMLADATATRELMQDTKSLTVTVLGGLLAMSDLPAPVSTQAGAILAGIQAYYQHEAFASAEDERRAHDKMVDAVAELKNLLLFTPGILPGPEGEQTRLATDAAIKVFKIIDRHSPPHHGPAEIRADLEDASGATIDFVQAVNPKVGGALKAGTGYPVMALAGYALGRMEGNREEMDAALKQNGTALDYYDHRIAEVARREDFYRERLSHTPPQP